MAHYDVAVLGGGPAGHAAALKAANLGAQTALIEREKLGGSCVNFSCIPTDALLSAAATYVDAQELAVMGVTGAPESFNFARAGSRAAALSKQVAEGVRTSLRMAKVDVISGWGVFTSPSQLRVEGEGEPVVVDAEGFVVATGTRWEPRQIPGLPSDRMMTPDEVQALTAVPASVLVHESGPGLTGFGLEYAHLLALAGADVSLAVGSPELLPPLDPEMREVVRGSLGDLGIQVMEGATLAVSGDGVGVTHGDGQAEVVADVVLEADPRRPLVEGLGLEIAGVPFGPDGIPIDRSCQTAAEGVFAAGDVTGGAMLSSVAAHQGEVAGENACGGRVLTRPDRIPRVLQLTPAIGWVGAGEQALREGGVDVVAGTFDLSFAAKAVSLGARQGIVKVVASRSLGEVVGVQAVGPGVAELLNLAALAMQAEIPVQELAAFVAWHPSMAEALVVAASRAAGQL